MIIKEIIKEAWPAVIGGATAGFAALQAYKSQQAPVAQPAAPQTAPAAPVTKVAPVDPTAQAKPAAKPAPVAEPKIQLPTHPRAQPLIKAAQSAGMKGVELAQFLAQMEHESWDFEKMVEVPSNKNYFKKYDPKHAPRQAKALGNRLPGDGERYRGRGYIQLTGRSNYQMASDALGIDLINKPQLAARPDVAAQVAVWYWSSRVRPNVRDFNDTAAVTKYINPGLRGLQDRHQNFKSYMQNI